MRAVDRWSKENEANLYLIPVESIPLTNFKVGPKSLACLGVGGGLAALTERRTRGSAVASAQPVGAWIW